MGDEEGIDDGVEVIHRDEDNYTYVANAIANTLLELSQKDRYQIKHIRSAALGLADLADWEHFIQYYQEAYRIALQNSNQRLSDNSANNG